MNFLKFILPFFCFFLIIGCSTKEVLKEEIDKDTSKGENLTKQNVKVQNINNSEVGISDFKCENWTLSSTFKLEELTFQGIKDQVAFILPPSIKAGETQKFMWHVWSDNEPKNLTVIAKDKDNHKLIYPLTNSAGTTFSTISLGGKINGADAATPSMMTFPSPGLWCLQTYVDDKPYGQIVISADK